jgi:hypothetical protein
VKMRAFDGECELFPEQPVTLVMSLEEARLVKAAIDELIEVAGPDWTFHLQLPITGLTPIVVEDIRR